MATYSDGLEHESSAKRIKLDPDVPGPGGACVGVEFPSFSATSGSRSEPSEATPPDCDSGYEASTMESLPTPPHLSADLDSLPQTPGLLDLSQDSIDPNDDNVSTVSELSGLSDLSGQDWKPKARNMTWIQKQMHNGMDPRSVLVDLGVDLHQIPKYINNFTLWNLIVKILAEPPRRHKLRHVNTLDDVVRVLKGAQKIIVLTGAGVSVSCGIPDFRSRDGIYSRLAIDFPDLPDPQAMFDISYFSQDPRPFFKFARDIYPGKFQPSPCHRFIRLLEKHGKLLRNYTQNIDTLEKEACIGRVIECHGSFATATCTKCGHRVTADDIRETVLAQNIPVCELCRPSVGPAIAIEALLDREPGELKDLVAAGIMKPDIVFFGEGLPYTFHEAMTEDKTECDLLVVIGSSLKVRPVALIPSSLPAHVPQILINREPLPHCHFDVELLGDCDVIINHLCHMLGANWGESIYEAEMLKETLHLLPWKTDANSPKKPRSPKKAPPTVEDCLCVSSSVSDLDGSCDCPLKACAEADDPASIKGRHMSVDSARDSGIGENSNFTDVDTVGALDEASTHTGDRDSFLNSYELELSSNGFKDNNKPGGEDDGSTFAGVLEEKPQQENSLDDMQGYWQPKQKRSITERLPKNSYYLIHPSRYIFPGAELYYDPDEKYSYLDSASSDSSDSESDNEAEVPDAF